MVQLLCHFGKSSELNRITTKASISTSRYLKKMESKDSSRYWYASVHCRIIHSSQKVKTTQVSIRRWRINKCGISLPWNIIQPWKRKGILSRATTRMNF